MIYYNYQNVPAITINLSIYRGKTKVLEDFSRASVNLWLVSKNNRIPISVTTNNGVISFDLPNGLSQGVYGIKAVWTKDSPYSLNGDYPCMPSGHSDKTVRAEVDNVFAIVNDSSSCITSDGVINLSAEVASYGYDGLDAYELSVLRGKTTLSESDWLDWMNSGSVPQPEPSQQPTYQYEDTWTVELTIVGANDGNIPADGKAYEYTAQARKRGTKTNVDGTQEIVYKEAAAEVSASTDGSYILDTAGSKKLITFTKNISKLQKNYNIIVAGKGDAEGSYGSKAIKQNAASMPYIISATERYGKALSFDESPAVVKCNYWEFSIKFAFVGDDTIKSDNISKVGDWFTVQGYDSTTKTLTVTITTENKSGAVKNGTINIPYGTDEILPISLVQSYVTSEVISWNNVALAYDDVPAGGTTANGLSPKTKTFKQIKTITRSNGYTDTEELQNTEDAVVTFSDTANWVNSSTGAVTYTTANGGAKHMLTEVTMKVVWNGKETTKKAAVYQEASKIYAIGGVSDTIPTSIDSMTAEANGTLNVSGSGKIFYVAIPSSKQITSWLDLNDDNYEMKSTIDTGSTFTYNGVSYTIYYSQNRIAQSNNYKITYA